MQSIQAFANLSVYRVLSKRHLVMKHSRTSTTPAFKKNKIRKSLCWNIKWHWVESSMLVVFDSFKWLFCNFVLCDKKGTSEKKKLSHDGRDISGIRASCLEKTVWNPRATPPLTCGRNHPVKDLVNEPVVLKANERYFNSRLFNLRLKHRNRVFISSPRGCVDCCFLQRLLRFMGPLHDCWCRSPPTINQIEEIQVEKPTVFLAWGVWVSCLMAFCIHAPLQVWRTSSSNSVGRLWVFLPLLEAVGWGGRLDYFVGSWAPHLDSH